MPRPPDNFAAALLADWQKIEDELQRKRRKRPFARSKPRRRMMGPDGGASASSLVETVAIETPADQKISTGSTPRPPQITRVDRPAGAASAAAKLDNAAFSMLYKNGGDARRLTQSRPLSWRDLSAPASGIALHHKALHLEIGFSAATSLTEYGAENEGSFDFRYAAVSIRSTSETRSRK